MIDSHNHLQQIDGQDDSLLDGLRASGIRQLWVNATAPDDFEAVASLAERHPSSVMPFFGLHPWRVRGVSADWAHQLRDYLLKFPAAGLGECGLDGWTCQSSLAEQREPFLAQLRIAQELDRPLSIHCLKAWGPLLDCLQNEVLPQRGFLIHAFGGSAEVASQLAGLGAYFSFNAYFMHERKSRVRETFRSIPADRLLVETDAPAMLPPVNYCEPAYQQAFDAGHNHPGNLRLAYQALAEIRKVPLDALIENIEQNARAFIDP